MTTNVRVYSSRAALAAAAAAQFADIAERAIAARGKFNVALSGGTTPREIYRVIALEYADSIEWERVHVYWGDERCVPLEDPENNAHMAMVAMLRDVSIPPENIHRIPVQLPSEEAADTYQRTLLKHFRDMLPRFDLILLGIGADGHTASLFPASPVLDEEDRWVVATQAPTGDADRVTLTLPVLNAALHILFLVVGTEKAEALATILATETIDDSALPAARVQPTIGTVTWMVDQSAMGQA